MNDALRACDYHCVANAADVADSADHPLIPSYEGSEIVKYDSQKFTGYRLMIAKATVYGGLDKRGGIK